MNGASTTALCSTRGKFGVPPPPLFHVVSVGGAPVAQPDVGQNVDELVFWIVSPEFQPPIVNRNPAIVAEPAPPTGADEIVASVPRSPVGLAGVNAPATMPDLSAIVVDGLSMPEPK